MTSRDYPPGENIPGTVYKVLRLIGVGGMGTVYDVEDTTIGKRYVLKTLHPKLGAREDLARRVQNEARTLARLNHPNIVDVITAGVTSDDLHLPYYVMERLNGQSLRVVLEKKGQLELAHAYHIGIDLLDALDHAHDKGLIHRDVKPDNIFLHRTAAGVTVTKLLDFGIVSVLDSGPRETAGRFLGTLRYAAPEQLRGEKPTPKMDVYAAALVIYEIVAGRGPFDDEGDGSRIGAAHMNKPPPRLSQFVAIPRELETLLMAALAKDPASRPRDAFSFAASLRNLKRMLQSTARQETTENRVTASAVLAPESRPSAEGQEAPSPSSSVPPTRLPQTTMVGMSPPTIGSLSATTSAAAVATTPEPPDRLAPTKTLATEVDALPQHGTEALPMSALHEAQIATTVDAATLPLRPPSSPPLRWPAERGAIRSEDPQVRSVPASAQTRTPPGALVSVALGVAAMMVLVAVLVAIRHAGVSSPAAPALLSRVPAPPLPDPVVALPAPTLAPPSFDDIAPSAAPVASSPPVLPPPAPVKKAPKPAAPHFAADRPGPGF
ncbi:MAG: protein kinase domain-containing protein [Polyangiaceae bacterium]